MELTYHRKGEYLFPNLVLQEEPVTIGKYGMLRKTYLKENKKNWYQSMLLTGKLDSHLLSVEEAAEKRMEVLMKELTDRFPAPDKAENQIAWVAHINNLMTMAEESVLTEVVYNQQEKRQNRIYVKQRRNKPLLCLYRISYGRRIDSGGWRKQLQLCMPERSGYGSRDRQS